MTKRQRLVTIAGWLVASNGHIGYPGGSIPFRPMPWMDVNQAGMQQRFNAGQVWYPDCSAFVTWCFKQAGFKDPNGFGYDGLGDSQIMWERQHHYSNPARAQAGALVVFGTTGDRHVCFVTKPGKNPELCSHGSAAGPIFVSFTSECNAHPGQAVTLLDVSNLI